MAIPQVGDPPQPPYVACNKIPRFSGALIAGDKPKRGANDLWGYASY